jgi:hypothetical protein
VPLLKYEPVESRIMEGMWLSVASTRVFRIEVVSRGVSVGGVALDSTVKCDMRAEYGCMEPGMYSIAVGKCCGSCPVCAGWSADADARTASSSAAVEDTALAE